MSEKIVKCLTDVGLSDKESHVYLAALEKGTAPVSKIADSAGYNRITTYTILEKLLGQGLVTLTNRSGVKHFTAISPEILGETVMQRAKNFKKNLPLLRSLAGGGATKPVVQFFDGLEGVKQAYRETLNSNTEILNYANSKNLREHWPEYDEEYVAERAKKKVFLRGLAPDDEPGVQVQEDNKKFFRNIHLLPQEQFWVENEINIFDDCVLITSFDPKVFALLIQSSAVAETQRQIFEMLWQQSGKT